MQYITDDVEIDDYFDMVKCYLIDRGIKFSEEHDFTAHFEEGVLTINREPSSES